MDLLQTFVFDATEHKVNIRKEESVGSLFQANDIGRVLGLTNIRMSINDFDSDEKVMRITTSAGGEQQTTFLTREGVYRLVMRSNKPVARPFQKWIASVIRTIEDTGRYHLLDHALQIQEEENQRLKEQLLMQECDKESAFREKDARIAELREAAGALDVVAANYKAGAEGRLHEAVLHSYQNKNVVYVGKIKEIDGNVLIKIGCTGNLKARAAQLAADYGSFTILRIFQAEAHRSFEQHLHQNVFIKRHRFTGDIHNGRTSKEAFLMPPDGVQKTFNIATRNVSQFAKSEVIVRLDGIQQKIESLEDKIDQRMDAVEDGMGRIGDAIAAPEEEFVRPNKRGRTQESGRKVQRYDLNGALVSTYSQIIDVTRDASLGAPALTRESIRRASDNGTAYRGFLWAMLDRHLPDDTVQEIVPQEGSKSLHLGPVAQLNFEKTRVLQVFPDRTSISKLHGYQYVSSVIKRIRKEQSIGAFYYVPWENVAEELRTVFEEGGGVVPRLESRTAKKIDQISPVTGDILCTYESQLEVTTKFRMGVQKLRLAISGDLVERGYKWRYHTA